MNSDTFGIVIQFLKVVDILPVRLSIKNICCDPISRFPKNITQTENDAVSMARLQFPLKCVQKKYYSLFDVSICYPTLAYSFIKRSNESKTFLNDIQISLLEKVIATDARLSYLYAVTYIKGRWLPGERVISTDAQWSYMYAKNVIKGLWLLGETAIATNAEMSLNYATNIVRGLWPLGENAIFSDPEMKKIYLQFVLIVSRL